MAASGVIQGVIAFALYVAGVLVTLRVARRTEPALTVVVMAPIACLGGFMLNLLFGRAFNFWGFAVFYWFLVMGFVLAFGAIYKSLSLRILLDLLGRPGHSDNGAALHDRYLIADSFQNRLAVILSKGLVSVNNDQYSLTQQGRSLALRVQSVQRVFGISRSG
jgi:hypothetical protein